MKLFRPSFVLIPTASLVALALAGCERAKAPSPVDSLATKPPATADPLATTDGRDWNPSAGPLLLIAAETPTRAFVVVPDSATTSVALANLPHPASVTLFGRSGTVQTAELPLVTDTSACIVATLNAAPPPRAWNVGFIGGVVSPLAMDSTESLPPADSATLVTWMNRLASALPNDSAGRFAGLPFVVRGLWRFTVPPGRQVVVANLMRQINQEATPLQENTFLVAERGLTDSAMTTVYWERSHGAEETIQRRDILAAALIGANRNASIIIARDFGDATAYGLIERGDDGKWRARWSSARRRC